MDDALALHGGSGGPTMTYGSVFFWWLHGQILMVEYYVYVGTNFRGDPDIPLPEDDQCEDISKKYDTFIVFFIF